MKSVFWVGDESWTGARDPPQTTQGRLEELKGATEERLDAAKQNVVKAVKQITGKEAPVARDAKQNAMQRSVSSGAVSVGTGAGGSKVEEVWKNEGPMQGMMWAAHKLYTMLWMESALSRVKR
jgi:hypothetical protein